jgi:hypothetical protein
MERLRRERAGGLADCSSPGREAKVELESRQGGEGSEVQTDEDVAPNA